MVQNIDGLEECLFDITESWTVALAWLFGTIVLADFATQLFLKRQTSLAPVQINDYSAHLLVTL